MTVKQDEAASLGDDAYTWLVTAITTFQLPANAQLSENRLAQEIGVSRTPIREALRRLETEGLVRRGDNNRFTVSLLTTKELNDACDLLILLDTYMFTRASNAMSPDDSRALEDLAQDMIDAAEQGDADAWVQADTAFHEVILRAADNPTVADIARVTRRRIQRLKDAGILQVRALINPDMLEQQQLAVIGVSVTESRLLETKGREISGLPCVLSVSLVSGRYDLIAEVLVDSNHGLIKFLTESLSNVEGISKTESFLMLKSYHKFV